MFLCERKRKCKSLNFFWARLVCAYVEKSPSEKSSLGILKIPLLNSGVYVKS